MARTRMVSNLHRLTVREVQAAGEGDHADGGGLLLRVRGDSASWVYRFTAASGRRREMGLGVAHRGSSAMAGAALVQARKAAHEARDLLQQGRDPIDERDAHREAARQRDAAAKASRTRERLTLARVAREYHERVIETSRTSKHSAQWVASLEHHVPDELWHAPIDSIDPPMLLAALSSVRSLSDMDVEVPETLKRVRQRLDAVFEDAIFHGHCQTNPAAAIKRKLQEAQGRRERGEFAALPYADAPAFMKRLRLQEGIAARCLEFAVLTAARTSEALEATWGEFDFDARLWKVPGDRMKAGEPHVVHLSAHALEVLRAMPRLHKDWVFRSPVLQDKPLSNMGMLVLLDRMGERHRTTVHGLCRATFSTWSYETNAGRPDVIEACLAHREADRVKAAYSRAKFAEERAALLDAWAHYLLAPAEADAGATEPQAA